MVTEKSARPRRVLVGWDREAKVIGSSDPWYSSRYPARRPSAAIGHVHRAVDVRSLVFAGGVHRGLAGERVHDVAGAAGPGLAPSASLSRVQTFMLMTIPMISRISSCEKCSASAS